MINPDQCITRVRRDKGEEINLGLSIIVALIILYLNFATAMPGVLCLPILRLYDLKARFSPWR